MAQVVERDPFQAGVRGGRVEASPLDVAVRQASTCTGREDGAGLVDGSHLVFEQQPDEIV